MRMIGKSQARRRELDGKESVFRVNNKTIPPRNIKRYLARKNISENELLLPGEADDSEILPPIHTSTFYLRLERSAVHCSHSKIDDAFSTYRYCLPTKRVAPSHTLPRTGPANL